MSEKLEVVVLRAALVVTSVDGKDTFSVSISTKDMDGLGIDIPGMQKAVDAFKAAEKVWLA